MEKKNRGNANIVCIAYYLVRIMLTFVIRTIQRSANMSQRSISAFDPKDLYLVGQVLSSFAVKDEETAIQAGETVERLDELIGEGRSELEYLSEYVLEQIQKYEASLPKEKLEPAEILTYLMEEHGHRQVDLTDLAPKSVISAVLNGKREMSKNLIRGLARKYSVNPSVFLK
jgi:HTH-type transcriptional regulator/antitoxin HigA